jgi:hypothetical protein
LLLFNTKTIFVLQQIAKFPDAMHVW